MSIAENLNCDYSDISSLFHEPHEEAGDGQGQVNTSGDGAGDQEVPESVARLVMNNLIIFLLLALVRLVTFINQNPIISLCLVIVMFLAKINSF